MREGGNRRGGPELRPWLGSILGPVPVFWSPMTNQSQWEATLGEDSFGNRIVRFSLEGDRGHIQMEAPAGELDVRDLDDNQVDRLLRSRAKSCIISWRDRAGLDRAVEVRVAGGRIMVHKLDGAVLALGERVEGGVGDQDGEWLISYVRGLV